MTVQDQIRITALRYGVDPALALAVAQQESGFRQSAVSPAGAVGVMQLMPKTAAWLNVDPYNEAQNIDGGVRYLSMQLKTFGGDETLALAAYNAGPGAVQQYGGVPPYAETQNFVQSVLSSVPLFDTGAPAVWPSFDDYLTAGPSIPSDGLGGSETVVLLAAAALAVVLLTS